MKFLKISLIASILIGLILLKIYFFPSTKSSAEPSKELKTNFSITNAEIIELRDFEITKEFSGELISSKETEISSERAGKIIGVFFNEGNNVEKGKLLVKLNDAGLQSQLKKLKINEEYLSVLEERKKNLLKINGISQQEYEATLTDLNNARAEIEYLNTQIDETEIKAPFSGKLGMMNIADGAYLTPGKPIVSIQQVDPIKLEFYIPEKNISEFKIGDMVNFKYINKSYSAKINAVNSKVDSDTRQIQIRAIASNSKNELTPGADVTVYLKLKPKEKSILIPTESLISSVRGKKVFVFKSGKAEEVQVECGIRTADKIEITQGLNIGDTLITSGIIQLRKGAPVKVNLKK